jgi:hypothetical protein
MKKHTGPLALHVLLLGSKGVGKTTFLNSLFRAPVQSCTEPLSLGWPQSLLAQHTVSFTTTLDSTPIHIHITDISDATNYQTLLPIAIRYADAFVLVFDHSHATTMMDLTDHISAIQSCLIEQPLDSLRYVILGNIVETRCLATPASPIRPPLRHKPSRFMLRITGRKDIIFPEPPPCFVTETEADYLDRTHRTPVDKDTGRIFAEAHGALFKSTNLKTATTEELQELLKELLKPLIPTKCAKLETVHWSKKIVKTLLCSV